MSRPLYLGQKKGFYEQTRASSWSSTRAQGGAAIVPGVVSGQFQFGFSNMTSLLVAQSNERAGQGRGQRHRLHRQAGRGLQRRSR